jgi:cytosine/uracil/thiamine/allantoin permease
MARDRLLICAGAVIGLLIAYAWLIEHHYYRITYAACEAGSGTRLCSTWNQQAIVEAAIVPAIAAVAWRYLRIESPRA